MAGGFLDVADGDAGVEGGGDEGVLAGCGTGARSHGEIACSASRAFTPRNSTRPIGLGSEVSSHQQT